MIYFIPVLQGRTILIHQKCGNSVLEKKLKLEFIDYKLGFKTILCYLFTVC